MTATYEKIATTNLGSASSSVSFSSISGAYTDLKIVIVAGQNPLNNGFSWQYNSDTGNNYSNTTLIGDGSSAFSVRQSNNPRISGFGDLGSSALSSLIKIDINNYSNTTTYKTALSRFDSIPKGRTEATVSLWRSLSAITSIAFSFENGSDTFPTGSTFTIYGIKAE
jgi:hypothetical protein